MLEGEAERIADDVVKPQLAARCSRRERPQEHAVQSRKNDVLNSDKHRIMPEDEPQRAENVIPRADEQPAHARHNKQPQLLGHGEKGLGDVHLNSLPRADMGPFLSRSP